MITSVVVGVAEVLVGACNSTHTQQLLLAHTLCAVAAATTVVVAPATAMMDMVVDADGVHTMHAAAAITTATRCASTMICVLAVVVVVGGGGVPTMDCTMAR